MSLATVCRRLATLVGVQPADVWIGNPDLTASEVVAWVQEAQQAVAAAHNWSSIIVGTDTTIIAPVQPAARVPIPDNVARIIPNTVRLNDRMVRGPLALAEWFEAPGVGLPAWTLSQQYMHIQGANVGDRLRYGLITAVSDYASDPDETALGAGVPEFVRMFETCILWSALAAYRDSKGLPAGTAASQAAAAIADARTRDLPIGAMTLTQRRRRHDHGGPMLTGNAPIDYAHALLDDLKPDDDPISDDT